MSCQCNNKRQTVQCIGVCNDRLIGEVTKHKGSITPVATVEEEHNLSNTLNPRCLPSRFEIFRYTDSETLIPKIRYPLQISAIVTPHPTKFHTFG
jgi:hypothetical protein